MVMERVHIILILTVDKIGMQYIDILILVRSL